MTGTLPDDESYNLVIGLLILVNQIDSSLKFLDLTPKSGFMVSSGVFSDCVQSRVSAGRLYTLSFIIEKCKILHCKRIMALAYFSVEFLARWTACGENARPPVLVSVDEGLLMSALGTACKTYNSTLLDASWSILRHSLRQKRAPNPESYLGKIFEHASLGNLQRAFSTLNEFENAYGNFGEVDHGLFISAGSCLLFSTLDSAWLQYIKYHVMLS